MQSASEHVQKFQTPSRGWRRLLSNLLGIDLASLAGLRVGLAVVLLLDLWYRSQDLVAHYTDKGILPRGARIFLYEEVDRTGQQYWWSLHMLIGDAWFQAILFLIAAWFAVWLLIGYRTRLSVAVSWVLLVSLQARNPMVQDGGDTLLKCVLFWSLFLPLGAVASVDRVLSSTPKPIPKRVVSVGTIALLFQVCMMYWFSVAMKQHPWWNEDYTAIYYTLSLDQFSTPLGQWLLQFPQLLIAMTAATFWLEWLGPLLAFSPVWTGRARTIAVFLFWGFHLSLGLTMELGLFPIIVMVSWIAFLPGEFWEKGAVVLRIGKTILASIFGQRTFSTLTRWAQNEERSHLSQSIFRHPERTRFHPRWYSSVVVTLLLCYVVAWNLRELDFDYWEKLLPRKTNIIGRITHLDQNWGMFAPNPPTDDGWYVMTGVLGDGSQVNLWDLGTSLPINKPSMVSKTYRNQRWRKYLLNLRMSNNAEHRRHFVNWLRGRWDRLEGKGWEGTEVKSIKLSFQLEQTPPPGCPGSPCKNIPLWKWNYE